MHVVLSSLPEGGVRLTTLVVDGADFARTDVQDVPRVALAPLIRAMEQRPQPPRWVWSDTAVWYPRLLGEGVSVARCVDLRLCHAILRASAATASSDLATAPSSVWDGPRSATPAAGLFELEPSADGDPVEEFLLQQRALKQTDGRLGLLLAAESAGALVAAEMTFAGVPWRADEHERILADMLGPRPFAGYRPSKLEAKLGEVRAALEVPELNPDSPGELMKALRGAGIVAQSTRSFELAEIDHPAIEPLLEYKKLARLMTANGWNWLDKWVAHGRFRPTYIPGGVVTGRWASDGGGALQLPHQVRDAVRADPGWTLVVADAAQLEPRILAAMAGDNAMAIAGHGGDLYEGMVTAGAVETRQQAKYGMLGAMYGGTTGESGRMLPRLARAFPRAIGLVEHAARAGERGERVSTWLGRTSPAPGASWRQAQDEASDDGASAALQSSARGQARSWGRFTRNFVVQGTAAEWALSWMASVRMRLRTLHDGTLTDGPHLAFFLHDEVMVHTPKALAPQVADILEQAAADAGRLLFPGSPVDFRVTVAVVDSYADAK
ncbi:bifunctional 3'-5' exonuclease/DNA polymerase [Salinibacterium sp. ZJ454]|uniref:bifunctional 3'-5' exonuclease/DNA polymerase n=1 Tax=Salinibacterium sp. ZJ454 TaxID=2708339 RepID=UPI00141D7AB1|nr:bifunctional 3'-5' exonuclease/DNA polymerase [Salinibacterium sp. ZJ454]